MASGRLLDPKMAYSLLGAFAAATAAVLVPPLVFGSVAVWFWSGTESVSEAMFIGVSAGLAVSPMAALVGGVFGHLVRGLRIGVQHFRLYSTSGAMVGGLVGAATVLTVGDASGERILAVGAGFAGLGAVGAVVALGLYHFVRGCRPWTSLIHRLEIDVALAAT